MSSPQLQLLPSDLEPRQRIVSISWAVAPPEAPPFPVDAVAEEEDTYLVLSAEATVREPRQPLLKVLAEVHAARPLDPGSVVVRDGRPLRLLAVVHALDEEPTWREEWIAEALRGIFRETGRRRLRSLGLPLLGSVHGRLAIGRSLELIRRVLDEALPDHLEHLWLMVADGDVSEVCEALRF